MGVTYYVPGAGLQDTADAAAVDTTGAASTTEQEAAAVSDVAVVGTVYDLTSYAVGPGCVSL